LKRKDIPYYFLIINTIIGFVLLPFAIVKRSFKDWVIVYLVSCIGNFFSDEYLVTRGYLKYPKKPFSKLKIHLPFDYFNAPLL
jgi:amino acid transporter